MLIPFASIFFAVLMLPSRKPSVLPTDIALSHFIASISSWVYKVILISTTSLSCSFRNSLNISCSLQYLIVASKAFSFSALLLAPFPYSSYFLQIYSRHPAFPQIHLLLIPVYVFRFSYKVQINLNFGILQSYHFPYTQV